MVVRATAAHALPVRPDPRVCPLTDGPERLHSALCWGAALFGGVAVGV
jgi:hypothetical protein